MLEHLTLRPQPVGSPLDAALSAFPLDREASRCTAETLEHYRYSCGAFVGWLNDRDIHDVAEVRARHIRAYLVSLQKRSLKDTTQRAHARGIKAWLNWLVREGDLDESPMPKVTMPKLEKRVPAPFTPQEIRRLPSHCDRKTPIGSRNYAIVLTLLDTGLRAAEFMSLRIGDIDTRSDLTMVMGKGQKQRQVRLGSGPDRAAVARMMGHREPMVHGDSLWIGYGLNGRESGALSVHGLQSMLGRLAVNAGVMPCSPHRFRRTFALWCLRDGMDLHSLRMLMGHSSLAVLQRYLALASEDVERAHRAHSPVDRLLSQQWGT